MPQEPLAAIGGEWGFAGGAVGFPLGVQQERKRCLIHVKGIRRTSVGFPWLGSPLSSQWGPDEMSAGDS